MGCDYYIFTNTKVYLKNGYVYKFNENSRWSYTKKGTVIEKEIIDENSPEVLVEVKTTTEKTEKILDENSKEITIEETIEKIYNKKYLIKQNVLYKSSDLLNNSSKKLEITRTTTNYKQIQVVNGIEKILKDEHRKYDDKTNYERHDDSIIIRSGTEKGWYSSIYDEDNETYEDYIKGVLNSEYNNEYKVLYENDKWNIKNYEEYLNDLKCYNIDLNHVRKIVRTKDTQERL